MPKIKCPHCEIERSCHIEPEINTFKCTTCGIRFIGKDEPNTLLDDVQKDRQSNYGQLLPHVICADAMMEALREVNREKNNRVLNWPIGFETTMFYLVTKIVRMSTDPHHHDSCLDLKSYADLWLKIIEEQK